MGCATEFKYVFVRHSSGDKHRNGEKIQDCCIKLNKADRLFKKSVKTCNQRKISCCKLTFFGDINLAWIIGCKRLPKQMNEKKTAK